MRKSSSRPDPVEQAFEKFQEQLPRQTADLGLATDALMASFWDEDLRRKARHLALVLSTQCSTYGFDAVGGIARALASLLRLKLEDVIPLQTAMGEKLQELVGLLHSVGEESLGRRTG